MLQRSAVYCMPSEDGDRHSSAAAQQHSRTAAACGGWAQLSKAARCLLLAYLRLNNVKLIEELNDEPSLQQPCFLIRAAAARAAAGRSSRLVADPIGHCTQHCKLILHVPAQQNGLVFEFSLCLSRACLGKKIVYVYKYDKKWLKKCRFRSPDKGLNQPSPLLEHQSQRF